MEYAVVTGACGGLAGVTVRYLLSTKEYTVFGLDIGGAADLYSDSNYHGIVCDVTDADSVKNAYAVIAEYTQELSLVFNFAGIVIMGSLVETDVEKIKKIVAVNVLGMQIINKYAYPFLKKGGGRIINMSSEYGYLTAVPFNGFYGYTKHAVEIYNDALRRELLNSDIKVIKICAGALKTQMQESITVKFEELLKTTVHYKDIYLKMQGLMLRELKHAKDPSVLLKAIKKAVYAKRPKLCYRVNTSFKMKLLSLLGARTQDRIFRGYFK
jgi:short-subunit dehydrogenase